jgi:hypothetical protein
MDNLDFLLLNSIRRYEDILALFVNFTADTWCNDPETLHNKGIIILQEQDKTALADADLIAILHEMSSTVPEQLVDHPLLNKRKDIMQQVLDHNRLLLTTINNIKSLLTHEIRELQSGHTAMTGYHQILSSFNGGIINDSR